MPITHEAYIIRLPKDHALAALKLLSKRSLPRPGVPAASLPDA
jgi:hypothetical protein